MRGRLGQIPEDLSAISSIDRYYDPQTGQFLSVDPMVATTGEAYAYTGDDPVNDTDPGGLDTYPVVGSGGGDDGFIGSSSGSGGVGSGDGGSPAQTGSTTEVSNGDEIKIHGNSRLSKAVAYLYRLYGDEDEYLKTGISQDPSTRYSKAFMNDKYMRILTSGSRSDMLDLERDIVEHDPGRLNLERWAGAKSGG